MPTNRSTFRLLTIAPAISFADRFGYFPVATAVTPITLGALSVATYLAAYGLSQPLWGLASDRFGRRRMIQLGLVTLVVANLLTWWLGADVVAIARLLAGVASGALLPTTLTLIGELTSADERQQVVARITAIASITGAIATAMGGVLAAGIGWQQTMAVFAALPAVGVWFALQLPSAAPGSQSGVAASTPRASGLRLAGFYGFAFFEGAMLLGVFPLVSGLIRQSGLSVGSAGLITAGYGLAAVTSAFALPSLHRLGRPVPLWLGGILLVVGVAAVGFVPTWPVAAGLLSSAFLGAAFSLFHSGFQATATQLMPASRGLGTGLFVGMVFTGAATGTGVGQLLWQYDPLLATSAMTALSIVVLFVGLRLLAAFTPEPVHDSVTTPATGTTAPYSPPSVPQRLRAEQERVHDPS